MPINSDRPWENGNATPVGFAQKSDSKNLFWKIEGYFIRHLYDNRPLDISWWKLDENNTVNTAVSVHDRKG